MASFFNISKTARSVDPGRSFRRAFGPERELHNLNAGAVFFRGMVTFDPSIIRMNWKRINQHPLVRAGNLVRAIARRSIRQTVRSPSRPGQPPHSHARRAARSPRGGENRPFKMIYSVPNLTYTSVMVGMVGFNARRPIPGVHEHGLTITNEFRARRGTPGARRITYARRTRTRAGYVNRPRTRWVVRRPHHYPERPFMYPALRAGRPRFASMWNYMTNPNMPKTPPRPSFMWATSISR